MLKMTACLFFSLLILFANDCFAVDCEKVQHFEKSYKCLRITTSDGLRLTGILYEKRHLDGSHLLTFSRSEGFNVFDSSGRMVDARLSSSQFVEVLEGLIIHIQRNGGKIDEAHLDMDIVDDTWLDIRTAVRKAVRDGRGPIDDKDRPATIALRNAIKKSRMVLKTCEMVKRHGMKCDPRNEFTEMIAFQQKQMPFDRKKIANASDAGLSEYLGFAIGFINLTSDKRSLPKKP